MLLAFANGGSGPSLPSPRRWSCSWKCTGRWGTCDTTSSGGLPFFCWYRHGDGEGHECQASATSFAATGAFCCAPEGGTRWDSLSVMLAVLLRLRLALIHEIDSSELQPRGSQFRAVSHRHGLTPEGGIPLFALTHQTNNAFSISWETRARVWQTVGPP